MIYVERPFQQLKNKNGSWGGSGCFGMSLAAKRNDGALPKRTYFIQGAVVIGVSESVDCQLIVGKWADHCGLPELMLSLINSGCIILHIWIYIFIPNKKARGDGGKEIVPFPCFYSPSSSTLMSPLTASISTQVELSAPTGTKAKPRQGGRHGRKGGISRISVPSSKQEYWSGFLMHLSSHQTEQEHTMCQWLYKGVHIRPWWSQGVTRSQA